MAKIENGKEGKDKTISIKTWKRYKNGKEGKNGKGRYQR